MLKKELETIIGDLKIKILKITNAHDYITSRHVIISEKLRVADMEREAEELNKFYYKEELQKFRGIALAQLAFIVILIAMLIIK